MSPMKLILGGYCLIILLGSILLTLPAASRVGEWTRFSDCLFTATSATCVTGLIRFDTATHWSLFGQLVILAMIQVGGVGFMTVAIMIMVFTKKKITLNQRSLMQNSVSAPQIGGIVRMTRFIFLGTLLVEGMGALLLAFRFVPRFGVQKGVYYAIFHSVSAFCNAGFDLMGSETGAFSSLTGFVGDWYVNLVLMLLIILGGLGFYVWFDLLHQKFRFRKLNLQSKMVLTISMVLVVGGALLLWLVERGGQAYEGMDPVQQVLASLFQSVTARTAGFNTIDLNAMSEAGKLVMICLMVVGGSPGSTAGGMKTTTLWVLCVSIVTTFRRKKNIEAFGRRMEEGITRTASCVFMIYLLLILSSAVLLSAVEDLPVVTALFEAGSAMATVGASFGVTPSLGMLTKWVIILLMLCGRVGSLTILLAFSSEKGNRSSSYPLEKVQIG